MSKIVCAIGYDFTKLSKWIKHIEKAYQLEKVVHGKGCYLGDGCILTPNHVYIGDDVYIGRNCIFQSVHGRIEIGDHVMFGPGVHIHGGNHRFDEIGKYMKDATPKRSDEDGAVKIGNDCWIGANAMILKGVEIGQGSVIGAGAIVTKDIPPYSVYVGVKAPLLRNRFLPEEIVDHEKLLKERYGK